MSGGMILSSNLPFFTSLVVRLCQTSEPAAWFVPVLEDCNTARFYAPCSCKPQQTSCCLGSMHLVAPTHEVLGTLFPAWSNMTKCIFPTPKKASGRKNLTYTQTIVLLSKELIGVKGRQFKVHRKHSNKSSSTLNSPSPPFLDVMLETHVFQRPCNPSLCRGPLARQTVPYTFLTRRQKSKVPVHQLCHLFLYTRGKLVKTWLTCYAVTKLPQPIQLFTIHGHTTEIRVCHKFKYGKGSWTLAVCLYAFLKPWKKHLTCGQVHEWHHMLYQACTCSHAFILKASKTWDAHRRRRVAQRQRQPVSVYIYTPHSIHIWNLYLRLPYKKTTTYTIDGW